MRHAAAWALALGASTAVVVGRVLVPVREEPTTVASRGAPPPRTTTVTRTVVVNVPARKRTSSTASGRRSGADAGEGVLTSAGRSNSSSRAPASSPAPAVDERDAPRSSPRSSGRAAPAPRARKPAGPQRVDGDAVDTRYGPVQIQLVLDGRRIVDVTTVTAPNDVERSRQITADAIPRLREQVLAAQSAQIDGVAGATYTSEGYRQSVQSALDVA